MQFFCELRYTRQDSAFRRIKREYSGSRLNERPRSAAKKEPRLPIRLNHIQHTQHPLSLLCLRDILGTFRRIPNNGLHSCCKRSLIPNSSSLVSPLSRPTDLPALYTVVLQLLPPCLAGQFTARQHNIAGKLNKRSQRCCWLSSVSRSLA